MVLLLTGKIILVVVAAGISDHDYFFLLRSVRFPIDPVIGIITVL
jgi:phenylalanine-4-hydroxylase